MAEIAWREGRVLPQPSSRRADGNGTFSREESSFEYGKVGTLTEASVLRGRVSGASYRIALREALEIVRFRRTSRARFQQNPAIRSRIV